MAKRLLALCASRFLHPGRFLGKVKINRTKVYESQQFHFNKFQKFQIYLKKKKRALISKIPRT
jgi:hypothetical protein